MTPFGAAVEPDVYCRKASDAESMSGSRQSAAHDRSIASVAIQDVVASVGAWVSTLAVIAAMLSVHRTALTSASVVMATSRGSARAICAACGGYDGTAMT